MIYKFGNIEIRVVARISIWQRKKKKVDIIFLEENEIEELIKGLKKAKRYLEAKNGTFKGKNQILQASNQDNKQGSGL